MCELEGGEICSECGHSLKCAPMARLSDHHPLIRVAPGVAAGYNPAIMTTPDLPAGLGGGRGGVGAGLVTAPGGRGDLPGWLLVGDYIHASDKTLLMRAGCSAVVNTVPPMANHDRRAFRHFDLRSVTWASFAGAQFEGGADSGGLPPYERLWKWAGLEAAPPPRPEADAVVAAALNAAPHSPHHLGLVAHRARSPWAPPTWAPASAGLPPRSPPLDALAAGLAVDAVAGGGLAWLCQAVDARGDGPGPHDGSGPDPPPCGPLLGGAGPSGRGPGNAPSSRRGVQLPSPDHGPWTHLAVPGPGGMIENDPWILSDERIHGSEKMDQAKPNALWWPGNDAQRGEARGRQAAVAHLALAACHVESARRTGSSVLVHDAAPPGRGSRLRSPVVAAAWQILFGLPHEGGLSSSGPGEGITGPASPFPTPPSSAVDPAVAASMDDLDLARRRATEDATPDVRLSAPEAKAAADAVACADTALAAAIRAVAWQRGLEAPAELADVSVGTGGGSALFCPGTGAGGARPHSVGSGPRFSLARGSRGTLRALACAAVRGGWDARAL